MGRANGSGWRRCAPIVGVALLLAGCAAPSQMFLDARPQVVGDTDEPPPILSADPAYAVSCPDEVEIQVASRTDCSGRFTISPEGRINLGALGQPRVEGDTEEGVARRIAALAGVSKDDVRARVTQFRSRVVYVYGPVKGPPRSIPYRGPEPVLTFLQRAGGLGPGAAIKRVYVVRPNVARGEQPQVFPIDLAAIIHQSDPRTNVILQPLDEVYVGETRRAALSKALPKWLQPAYHRLCRLWGGCPVELEMTNDRPGGMTNAPPMPHQ
jgi:polysaccharide biosynthesis/export protein